MEVKTQLEGFVKAAQAMLDAHYAANCKGVPAPRLEATIGPKYAKVVSDGSSAWCFIDMSNGDILKAASWGRPAKTARGTIMREDFGVSFVGPYGPAYLR
jgi:hypothetical protein